jgi:uncharacterized protein (DUF849 family)
MLSLRPKTASLSVGSNNFQTSVYENSPDLVNWLASEMRTRNAQPEIETFDLGHVELTCRMVAGGRLRESLRGQFVLEGKDVMPTDERNRDFSLRFWRGLCPMRSGAAPTSACATGHE